ncbi:hypothetical protein MGMO_11c00180 [Methyloglobulus morosus KoM1]|uniref:Uncharacterized protein n=1 Tax=Methyloglobulus morosus KoM1 TaxID=1116472 RepID=V5E2D3_9GAMM|nr:hypothetical protein [Methyloglobulus morosus]ESS73711.1 hypothetical protein MGMO_11c00180 [Methyloglobulus morosus KoM1]
MAFDMKQEWSDTHVAALLSSVKDDRDWRLEVDKEGMVSLQDKTANPTGADYDTHLHCYFELWQQGTDYVGASAASDKQLVGTIANALRKNYPALEQGQFVYI